MGKTTPITEKQKLTSCDALLLGTVVGHLTDHGFTDEEINGFVSGILRHVRLVKNDPERSAKIAEALRLSVTP